MKVGFAGGLVVDFPNSTKAKKYYLCLFAGMPNKQVVDLPKALSFEEEEKTNVEFSNRRITTRKKGENRPSFKSKEWILSKKDVLRKKGKDVKSDSKYTGRKRNKF
jgi:18S rRNA (guanine1575-N7)-methyltransferase